jgi:HAMP domain-containing protein
MNAIQMQTLVVLGRNFLILNHTNRTADVYTNDTNMKPIKNVPIISGATACDYPFSGKR